MKSEKSLKIHQIETKTLQTNTSTSEISNIDSKNIATSQYKSNTKSKFYIKPLATVNDISFVVIDKNILEQLEIDITDPTITIEEEITFDGMGILLRIRRTN